MSGHTAWKKLFQLGPFRWAALTPWRGGRVALGISLPLFLGWLLGYPAYGAYAALGALPAGNVTVSVDARGRVVLLVILASIDMALSGFVGSAVAESYPIALIPIVAIWGYGTGLSVALGQRASTVMLQCSLALLIAVGVPAPPSEAVLRAVFVVTGGLFQAVLVVLSWRFRPGSEERAALAETYRSLGGYAGELAAGRVDGPPAIHFPARAALDDPNPLLASSARLAMLDLLEQAERIRASLAALGDVADENKAAATTEIRGLLRDAAVALDTLASAIVATGEARAAAIAELRQQLEQPSLRQGTPWTWAGEALLGQLRAAGRTVAVLRTVSVQRSSYGQAAARALSRTPGGLATVAATLRANMGLSTEAGQHGLRLAVTAALAEAAAQAIGLNQGRWVTLTVFLILKPDYGTTMFRGVQRAFGTLIGAALAVGAAAVTNDTQGWLLATGSLSIACAYALFDVSYLLFSIFLTNFVVVLLAILGSPFFATAEARFFDTLIGSAWAIAAYVAWPTWEGASAHAKFAHLVDTHRLFGTRLLSAFASADPVDVADLRRLQFFARKARSDAEAATVRLADEPMHHPLTPELAQMVIAIMARLAHAELALHALVLSDDASVGARTASASSIAKLQALAGSFDVAMSSQVSALTTMTAPRPIPALRPLQVALQDDDAYRETALAGITDRLVDGVNSLDAALRHRLPRPPDASRS
ncbi:MAG: FUSC family protein [Acetobacteraceae bacterium]|nr:FUSC family protein [Acetobacteraceae bacterium]